jgi:cation diffusion facilitator family transporter
MPSIRRVAGNREGRVLDVNEEAQHRDPSPIPVAVQAGQVRRVTWVGLALNLVLAAAKFAGGLLGSSQAVVADAVHSLSDVVTDIAVLLGVRYWSAPADDSHPYGHHRIETLITAGIGLVLVIVGVGIAYHAIVSVRSVHLRQPGWIAFGAAVLSIASKEWLYRWTVAVGRRIRSSALVANAWHHRSDSFSSYPAALAVVIALIDRKLAYVDHIGALIVSLFILHAAWRIVKPAFSELADAGAPDHVRALIQEVGLSTPEVTSVHAIRTRHMGSSVFVDLHITVDGATSVARGHEISEIVSARIRAQVPDVIDVVVHLEPHGHVSDDAD